MNADDTAVFRGCLSASERTPTLRTGDSRGGRWLLLSWCQRQYFVSIISRLSVSDLMRKHFFFFPYHKAYTTENLSFTDVATLV